MTFASAAASVFPIVSECADSFSWEWEPTGEPGLGEKPSSNSPLLREELSVKNRGVCEWLGVPLGPGVLQRG